LAASSAKGCDEDSADKIVPSHPIGIGKNLLSTGFDPAAIDASMHQLEFDRTEIGAA